MLDRLQNKYRIVVVRAKDSQSTADVGVMLRQGLAHNVGFRNGVEYNRLCWEEYRKFLSLFIGGALYQGCVFLISPWRCPKKPFWGLKQGPYAMGLTLSCNRI